MEQKKKWEVSCLGTTPYIDEARFLILKLIEQSIRDFVAFENASTPIERYYFLTASGLLFEDEYRISWGDEDKSMKDLADIVGLDHEWLRNKTWATYKKKKKLQKGE